MSRSYKIFRSAFGKRSIKKAYIDKIGKTGTRGIDGIGLKKFNQILKQELEIISSKCKRGTYKFSPYVEKLFSKGRNKKPRVISLPTIRDRIVLYLLKEILHQIFPDCVNRKIPNVNVREIKNFLNSSNKNQLSYFKTDLKSFYDSIDIGILTEILKTRIKSNRLLNLLVGAIKRPTVPKSYQRKNLSEFRRKKGIPQGLAISNILANIYLQEVDKYLNALGVAYFRYVDDILIFSEKENITSVVNKTKRCLKKKCLTLNADKTEINPFTVSFVFLGYKFSYASISVRKSSVERFIKSIAAKISIYKYNSEKLLKNCSWITEENHKKVFIEDLNEKITGAYNENKRYGWLFYFIEIDDISLLYKLDKIIKSFFRTLPSFRFSSPPELKSLVKAFFKAKYEVCDDYIHNYDKYKTLQEKFDYLCKRGLMNPAIKYGEEEISAFFDSKKRKNLSHLELDVGIIS